MRIPACIRTLFYMQAHLNQQVVPPVRMAVCLLATAIVALSSDRDTALCLSNHRRIKQCLTYLYCFASLRSVTLVRPLRSAVRSAA